MIRLVDVADQVQQPAERDRLGGLVVAVQLRGGPIDLGDDVGGLTGWPAASPSSRPGT